MVAGRMVVVTFKRVESDRAWSLLLLLCVQEKRRRVREVLGGCSVERHGEEGQGGHLLFASVSHSSTEGRRKLSTENAPI
jgi:hypothetical protein